jgi:hypothetical protein
MHALSAPKSAMSPVWLLIGSEQAAVRHVKAASSHLQVIRGNSIETIEEMKEQDN